MSVGRVYFYQRLEPEKSIGLGRIRGVPWRASRRKSGGPASAAVAQWVQAAPRGAILNTLHQPERDDGVGAPGATPVASRAMP